MARRVLVLWSSQHDTGAMELVSEEAGGARVVMRNFGSPSREVCAISGGYIAETFEISGYKNVRVRKQACCMDGAAECCWQVSWSD
jgi:predicted hydrocarbon binding protein